MAGSCRGRLLDLDGHRLRLTDLERPAWPAAEISRGELLGYYLEASESLLPFLRGRPASVVRRVEEGLGPWVFDRNPGLGAPPWITRCRARPEFSPVPVEAVVVGDRATLAYLIKAGCVAFHPWSAPCPQADRPDRMVFDVDPTQIAFREVRNAALLLRDLLARYQIRSWVKTSGGRGLHVLVPLRSVHSFADVRAAAALVARSAHAREPGLFTFEARRARRRGRILVDVERNRLGASLVSPFSVKPESGLISMPLTWAQLGGALYPEDFSLAAVRGRMAASLPPVEEFFDHPQSIDALLEAVAARARRRPSPRSGIGHGRDLPSGAAGGRAEPDDVLRTRER